jgi:hypothetical protein
MRGMLLVWIGLMGAGCGVGVYLFLRLFPRAFSESEPAVAWPWQRSAGSAARLRGGLLLAWALLSAAALIAGLHAWLWRP